jgi:phage terminase large subunit-like protein
MFQFASIYGFYKANGVRLVTEALLFVPRKYGKTTLCAVLALEDVLFGDCDAEAYISSNQFQQSQICFKAISKMLRMLDAGHGHFKFRRDTIDVSLPKRESLIRCLPYSPDKLDGLKASIGIYDELAQADSFDQKNVIASSMGTRAAPLLVDITTASAKTEIPILTGSPNELTKNTSTIAPRYTVYGMMIPLIKPKIANATSVANAIPLSVIFSYLRK